MEEEKKKRAGKRIQHVSCSEAALHLFPSLKVYFQKSSAADPALPVRSSTSRCRTPTTAALPAAPPSPSPAAPRCRRNPAQHTDAAAFMQILPTTRSNELGKWLTSHLRATAREAGGLNPGQVSDKRANTVGAVSR